MKKSPFESATSVPRSVEPLNSLTVEFGSAFPFISGVVSLVDVELVVNEVGAEGPVVSITTAASAVLSSISNLGPGFEGINPHSSYNFFSSSSKVLLTFLMLLGRLEIFTMIALLLPSFWRKY